MSIFNLQPSGLAKRLDALKNQVAQVYNLTAFTPDKLNRLENRLIMLQTSMNDVKSMLTNLETRMSEASDKLNEIETTLEGDVDRLITAEATGAATIASENAQIESDRVQLATDQTALAADQAEIAQLKTDLAAAQAAGDTAAEEEITVKLNALDVKVQTALAAQRMGVTQSPGNTGPGTGFTVPGIVGEVKGTPDTVQLSPGQAAGQTAASDATPVGTDNAPTMGGPATAGLNTEQVPEGGVGAVTGVATDAALRTRDEPATRE